MGTLLFYNYRSSAVNFRAAEGVVSTGGGVSGVEQPPLAGPGERARGRLTRGRGGGRGRGVGHTHPGDHRAGIYHIEVRMNQTEGDGVRGPGVVRGEGGRGGGGGGGE